MKCKGCNEDITKTLVMVEEAYGDKITSIIGIETDPENFTSEEYAYSDKEPEEGDFEIVLGGESDPDVWFEFSHYQCNTCKTEYSWDEIKEIFK